MSRTEFILAALILREAKTKDLGENDVKFLTFTFMRKRSLSSVIASDNERAAALLR